MAQQPKINTTASTAAEVNALTSTPKTFLDVVAGRVEGNVDMDPNAFVPAEPKPEGRRLRWTSHLPMYLNQQYFKPGEVFTAVERGHHSWVCLDEEPKPDAPAPAGKPSGRPSDKTL